jgi:hypothetical protein
MKAKFYKNTAAFIVILSVILFAVDWTLKEGFRSIETRSNYKLRGILDEHSIDAQIMVFGSSVAEGGISPEELNKATSKQVFNSALSGRRVQDWSAIAFEYLSYSKDCEIIVLSVFPNSFNKLETIYHPHDFYPYLSNSNVREALGNINPIYTKMSLVPFYSLNHLNSSYILDAGRGWKIKMGTMQICEQCPDGWGPPQDGEFKAKEASIIPVDTARAVTQIYERLMAEAAAKNIKVVFVGTPVYHEGMALFEHTDHIYNQCKVWAKQENVYFFNHAFDEDIVQSKDNFANNTHLNQIGATIFSHKLGQDLKTVLGIN